MQPDLVLLIWPTVAEREKLVKIQWLLIFKLSVLLSVGVCEHIVIVA